MTRSNSLFFAQFQVGEYQVCNDLVHVWAWTFYTFLHSLFFSIVVVLFICFRCQMSHPFQVPAYFFFVHSFIHWLYCRWRQLSPFRNAVIFMLRSPTTIFNSSWFSFFFLFLGYFLTNQPRTVWKGTVYAVPIQDDFRPIFYSFKMYWFKIYKMLLTLSQYVCVCVWMWMCNFQYCNKWRTYSELDDVETNQAVAPFSLSLSPYVQQMSLEQQKYLLFSLSCISYRKK